jgi:hypothetical protein
LIEIAAHLPISSSSVGCDQERLVRKEEGHAIASEIRRAVQRVRNPSEKTALGHSEASLAMGVSGDGTSDA